MAAMPDWGAQYDEGVPRSLAPYPDRTLLDLLREGARERPGNPALLFKGTTISYDQLERLAAAAAAALATLGVQKGDRVALLLPNSPQAMVALFGAWGVGAIAVPLNPLYTASELGPLLREVGCETAIVFAPFYEKVKSVQAQAGLRCVIATSIEGGKGGQRPDGLAPGDSWLPDLLARHASRPAPDVKVRPDDEAVLLFTGGTTGSPKAAVGSHRCLVTSGMQLAAWGRVEPWKDVSMLNVPLFHTMGMCGVLPACLVNHSPMCLVPNPRDLDDLVATMREAHPAFLAGVPTLYVGLLGHPAAQGGRAGLDSLKICLCGGAPLMRETQQRFEELAGCSIIEGYSLTEAMMACVANPVGRRKPGSVGVPFPDVEVRVVDSAGEDLPSGEVGEILLRAPQLMLRYWGRPDETAHAIRDGWLYTGDLGYLDAEGYLFLAGRQKELIKTSGFQVWPREVEEVLSAHPAVAEAGVAGVPDAYQGQAVKAWVVLRAGQEATADALRAHCRERLAPYKVPRDVEFRDALPKSAVGKVLRRELLASEAGRQAAKGQAVAAGGA